MESIQAQPNNFRRTDRWNSVPVPARVAERAYSRVDVAPSGCWISRYSVASHGYAQIGWQDGGHRYVVLAHRAAWTLIHGQVPVGMTLDHICKERRCVNPDHLRVLPNFENARRVHGLDWKLGYCANGHPNSELREIWTQNSHTGGPRLGRMCGACKSLYCGRNNWRTQHPGEPMPEHLLLASERPDDTALAA